jgi:hypothetical protein
VRIDRAEVEAARALARWRAGRCAGVLEVREARARLLRHVVSATVIVRPHADRRTTSKAV